VIGIPLAIAVFSYGEWAAHKYLLHALGRDKQSAFAFHFHTHHQNVRRSGGYDPDYEGPVWSTPTQAGEAIGLITIGLAHLPLVPVAPFYTATTWYLLAKYRRDHRRCHIDPAWGREHLPWHYDHHMGKNQHRNWGVTFQWFDRLAGTRVRYVGTPDELDDRPSAVARARKARATWEATCQPARGALDQARDAMTGLARWARSIARTPRPARSARSPSPSSPSRPSPRRS
jgi:sterol desaturase/sphingolipid hydroxylase (fatty acid hydroxylase superfamily)